MAYVVTKACLGAKNRNCVEVCPVDCFYDIRKVKYNDMFDVPSDGKDGDPQVGMLMINPDECISCGACEGECPEQAIYEESLVPDKLQEFIGIAEEETTTLSTEELDNCRCTSK
ncbi:MAG: ferredoxin family protein [Deltaproteobacteria bacterium]|nr:ferredoxin family protein [Deltaproteobacteria bacterium]